MKRRIFLKLLLLGAAATTTGCFGSFKAVHWVYNLNKGVSSSKFVQWLVFLGLVILPVYELAGMIDVLILNSLEFWGISGSAGVEGETRTIAVSPTKTITISKDAAANVLTFTIDDDGRVTSLEFQMTADGAYVTSAGRVLAEVRETATGGVEIASSGSVIERHDATEVGSLIRAFEDEGGRGASQWARRFDAANGNYASR